MKSVPMAYRVSHAILSVMLVATFVSVFFFLYVSNVERKIVQIQMGRIVSAFMKPVQLLASPAQIADIRKAMDRVQVTSDPTVDGAIAATNNRLIRTAAIAFGTLFGVGLLAIGLMWKFWHKFDVLHLLKTNALIIAVVAFVYFMFVTFVVRAYFLIDSNYVRGIILEQVDAEQRRRGVTPHAGAIPGVIGRMFKQAPAPSAKT